MYYAFNVNGIANITNDASLIPNGTPWIELQTNNISPINDGYYTVDYEQKILKSVPIGDKNNVPREIEPVQSKIQAIIDQQTFLEGCIAEMATEVYK